MKKKAEENSLVDLWAPPSNAGAPVGFITTTFTFEADFFEDECLSRFLQLDSDREDGIPYYLEMEEKLAPLRCASVWVDQSWCRTDRNLRWDLLPIRISGAILHAKVSVLCWANCVRFIVASANMSRSGIGINQEIYQSWDLHTEMSDPFPYDAAKAMLAFLGGILDNDLFTDSRVKVRPYSLIKHVRDMTDRSNYDNFNSVRGGMRVRALFTHKQSASLISQLSSMWTDELGTLPSRIDIMSPFFDDPNSKAQAADSIKDLLRKRGETEVHYYTTAEAGESGEILLHAPESIQLRLSPLTNNIHFYRVTETANIGFRPLHAKAIYMESDAGMLFCCGSSNFTRKGLGLAEDRNYEANIAVLIRSSNVAMQKQLASVWPDSTEINKENLRFKPRKNADEEKETCGDSLLPFFFQSATLISSSPRFVVELEFDRLSQDAPGFRIEHNGTTIYAEADWLTAGCPQEVKLTLTTTSPPMGFDVHWSHDTSSWIPLNILDRTALAPPEQLRNLPLDMLAAILTSARPMHQVIARLLHKLATGDGATAGRIDPHKSVDTSMFLLQRTRRYGNAINALCERLTRPVYTDAALQWRLTGPIGMQAFINAVIREGKDQNEIGFLLAELLLESWELKPAQQVPNTLSPAQITRSIRKFLRSNLIPEIDRLSNLDDSVAGYIHRVKSKTSASR